MSEARAARDYLALAVDVPLEQGLRLYEQVSRHVGWAKVGLSLFVEHGPAAVAAFQRQGARVFLDLKLHDIPETVGRAVRTAAGLGVELLTVHSAGGAEMLRRAAEAAGPALGILGVTVLTSLTADDLHADGIAGTVAETVARRAALAARAGIAGLVCSPHEVGEARAASRAAGKDLLLVVPGVRPAGAPLGDQKRVATPAATVKAGADYLVVGRPIRDAAAPAEAFEAIVREIEAA
jgi:orotidine-5'-phosphate decarboxylase